MIVPPDWAGSVAFSEARDGDLRSDLESRSQFSKRLGIAGEWATVNQVHGANVIEVSVAGPAGDGDALWTTERGLAIAVFTADCFGVTISAGDAIGIAHVGWRGAAAGVVTGLRHAMERAGFHPYRAAIGPGIGPCCFEVGPDVSSQFPDVQRSTTWGTDSVDLPARLRSDLEGLSVWSVDRCTMHEKGWFSHRGSQTTERLATVAWL